MKTTPSRNKKARMLGKVLLASIFIASCQKYDDTQIRSEISSLDSRVTNLETLCKKVNEDISALKISVNALENKVYIKSVTTLTTGYQIEFTDGHVIVISDGKDGKDGTDGIDGKDGKDGEDGHSPIISAKQSDGIFYWTVDEEWLLDSEGNKIPTTGVNGKDGKDGTDGKDGITPIMKIENDYWYVSVDEGQTWEKLGKAKGEDGDSMFSSVELDERYVYMTLCDGTIIKLEKAIELSLEFEKTQYHPSSQSIEIPFAVKGAGSDLRVAAFNDAGALTEITRSEDKWTLKVSFLNDEYFANILVVAKSGNGSVTELLELEEGVLRTSSEKEFSVGSEGGRILMSISHNVQLEIATSEDWIKQVKVTKTIITENLYFDVEENQQPVGREGIITVSGEGMSLEFKIRQAQKDILKLEQHQVTLFEDDTKVLTYETNVSSQLLWSSADSTVATVDQNGIVSVKGLGNSDIVVRTIDGSLSDTCKVTVCKFSDKVTASCFGGTYFIVGTLLKYGSTLYWRVQNETSDVIKVVDVYLVDGETGSTTGRLSLSADIASGSSGSWGISVPLVGIHLPVTAVFTINYNGKQHTVSGVFNI